MPIKQLAKKIILSLPTVTRIEGLDLKKVFLIIVILTLLIIETVGCSTQKTADLTLNETYSLDAMFSDQFCFVKDKLNFTTMTKIDTGYYFLGGVGKDYIFYFDKTSLKPVLVCNKPECVHINETDIEKKIKCNAYIGGQMHPSSNIVSYKSDLYLVVNEIVDFKPEFYLYRISNDGTTREKIYKFENIPYCIMQHNNAIYYITNDFGTIQGKENESSTRVCLYRLNIDQSRIESRIIYENKGIYANILNLIGYKNNIYFSFTCFEDSTLQIEKRPLLCLNIDSGNVTEVCKAAGKFAICNNHIVFYLFDGEKGNDFVCDLNGENLKMMDNLVGLPYSDYEYIITDTTFLVEKQIKDSSGNKISKSINIYDIDGVLKQSINIDKFKKIDIFGSDENYIFIVSQEITDDDCILQNYYYIMKADLNSKKLKLTCFFSLTQRMDNTK